MIHSIEGQGWPCNETKPQDLRLYTENLISIGIREKKKRKKKDHHHDDVHTLLHVSAILPILTR